MGADEKLESDLQALARASERDLPGIDETARALAEARVERNGGFTMSKIRKPMLAGALTVAAVIAVLVFPVPYSRQRGFDVTITRSDGKSAQLHLPGRDRARAQARAAQLAHGGTVTIAPHVERVWGSVYAMAEDKLFHVDIDLQGKSAGEIEGEIKSQLAAEGWSADDVQVQRSDEGTSVSISASGNGGGGERQIEVISKSEGAGPGAQHLEMQGLEIEHTAGMTDAQLRQKILDQLKARGLEGEVTVENGEVRVKAKKTVEQP